MNLKRFFRKPQESNPIISEAEAISIAQSECAKRHWTWLEPVKVQSKNGTWIICTNWESLGVNAVIAIDQITGEVIRADYTLR